MAEEVLVKEYLSSEMISGGDNLARYFDQSELEINALFWVYVPEANTWRFMVATPEVNENGRVRVYEKLREIYLGMPKGGQSVDFSDVYVTESDDRLVELLRSEVKTDNGLSQIRITRNIINWVLIDDVLIYKMT